MYMYVAIAVVGMRHLHFISVVSLLKGESKTLLNTQEENLTIDIDSIIFFSG